MQIETPISRVRSGNTTEKTTIVDKSSKLQMPI